MIYYLHSGLRWMTWIVTTVYFLFTPLMGLIYFTYAAAVLFEGSSSLRRGLVFWMIPGVAYSLVVLANPLTGMLFVRTDMKGEAVFISPIWSFIFTVWPV